MLFSIIVPVYKVEKYLERCVDSILSQSFKDIEILLIDDGSPDKCPEICDRYASSDTRIRVYHKENGGLSDARNYGLSRACGDYVLFIDSDDCVVEGSLAEIAKICDLKPDVIAFDGVTIGGRCDLLHISDVGMFESCEFLKRSLAANKMPNPACINAYRRDFLNVNGLSFKVGILHEDEHFTPRVFLAAKSVYNSGIELYEYYIREDSITTSKDKRKNARDLYSTCLELSDIYAGITDKKMKKLLMDSLAVKYLNMFQVGALHKYGREYVHRMFALKHAKRIKNRIKAMLFFISPALYYKINVFVKRK